MLSDKFITEALGVPALQVRDAFTIRDPLVSAAAMQIREVLSLDNPSGAMIEALATVIAYRIGIESVRPDPKLRGADTVAPLSKQQLKFVTTFVEENLDSDLRPLELARHLDMSVWHFMRRFRASFGSPPHTFITERRFARAQQLLLRSKLSITEVALEVGMNHSHFSRSFLDRFGMSPRDFRRENDNPAANDDASTERREK